jgi:hypothetical protein
MIKIEIVTPLNPLPQLSTFPRYGNISGQGRSQLSVNEGNINDNEPDNHCKQIESEHIAHVVAGDACPSTHFAHFVCARPGDRSPPRYIVTPSGVTLSLGFGD